jgi:hypothetical protein
VELGLLLLLLLGLLLLLLLLGLASPPVRGPSEAYHTVHASHDVGQGRHGVALYQDRDR